MNDILTQEPELKYLIRQMLVDMQRSSHYRNA